MATFQQTALLGTERLTTPPVAPHAALDDAWHRLDWVGDREGAMLDALALVGVAQAAGSVATRRAAVAAGAEPDTRAFAPAAAAALLPQLLEGEFRALLPEWLGLCAQAGTVLPPAYLPRVFGAASAEERGTLAPVLGERGRWLLRQNPAWHRLLDTSATLPDDTWELGSPAERLAWLRARRCSDPAEALTRLQKGWAEEAADFREQALAELAAGLSAADEPFLAGCLSDRRKEVRQTAQRLLARLPASALAGRMRERATSLVTYQRGFLSKRLEVEPPAAFDKAWKADAVEERPPAGVGEKAYWVRQIVACVPFAELRTRTGLGTSDLVGLALKGEWGELLSEAWYASLAVAPDAELAAELFRRILGGGMKPPGGQAPAALVATLLPLCAEAERWTLALDHAGQGLTAWLSLPHLPGNPEPWQAARLLAALAPAIRDGAVPGGSPQAVLVARRLPMSLRAEAARLVARENGPTKTADTFLRAFDLRAAMRTAFSAKP